MTFDAFSPEEVIEAVANAGVKKGNMRLDKVFLSSVSAGCLLAFACGTVLSTNATPWYQDNAAGLMRTIAALVFPYGLCMIILTGADLCTGSFMVCGRFPELIKQWSFLVDMRLSLPPLRRFSDGCLGGRC